MQTSLLYAGSGIIFLWGIGHMMPTKGIVSGFGTLSPDNLRIITMEWLAEGLTLCFIGFIVALSTILAGPAHPGTILVGRACAGMLLVLALLSTLTGARTSIIPMKLCPVVKTLVAAMFLIATFL